MEAAKWLMKEKREIIESVWLEFQEISVSLQIISNFTTSENKKDDEESRIVGLHGAHEHCNVCAGRRPLGGHQRKLRLFVRLPVAGLRREIPVGVH